MDVVGGWDDRGAYVPGGPWPRPPATGEVPPPIEGDAWAESPTFRRGVDLFNAAYYWEAHEAWEGLWHAHGRRGPAADVLKGLIKLAAAAVKVRQGQPRGAVTHARRAAACFEQAAEAAGPRQLGLDLAEWIATARGVAEGPPIDREPPGARVSQVFDWRIEPA